MNLPLTNADRSRDRRACAVPPWGCPWPRQPAAALQRAASPVLARANTLSSGRPTSGDAADAPHTEPFRRYRQNGQRRGPETRYLQVPGPRSASARACSRTRGRRAVIPQHRKGDRRRVVGLDAGTIALVARRRPRTQLRSHATPRRRPPPRHLHRRTSSSSADALRLLASWSATTPAARGFGAVFTDPVRSTRATVSSRCTQCENCHPTGRSTCSTARNHAGFASGAAQESNLPTDGLHRPAGFEDRMGHRARATPGRACNPRPAMVSTGA